MQQNQRYHILYVIKSSYSNPGDYITHDATHTQCPLEPEKALYYFITDAVVSTKTYKHILCAKLVELPFKSQVGLHN